LNTVPERLGLAIVANIVEKRWGELSLERSPRGGLRVPLRLPRE
jgi:signal transduction histidine kinase